MRKSLIIGGVVLGLLVAAVAALPLFIDPNQFRGTVQSQLESELKRPVSLGNMALTVFPLAIRIDNVKVGQPPSFQSPLPFLTAKSVSAGVALFPLLRKQVQVQAVTLTSPEIELIKQSNGHWNYETGTESGKPAAGPSLSFDDLRVVDGKLAITDLQAGTPRSVYEHIDLHANNFGPGRTAHVNGSVRMDSMSSVLSTESDVRNAADNLSANGTFTLKADKSPDALNVSYALQQDASAVKINSLAAKIGALSMTGGGTLDTRSKPAGLAFEVKTADAPVRELLRIANLFGGRLPPDITADGQVNVNLHVSGTTEKPLLNGKVYITKAQISGKSLAEPVRASELQADFAPDTITTQPFTIETGNTRLTGRAVVTGYSTATPKIDAELRTSDAKVEELLRMADAYGIRPQGINGSGTISLDVKVSKTGNNLDYAGSGTMRDVQLSSPDLPKPLGVASASANFGENSVKFDKVQASLGSLHLNGAGSIRDFARPQIQVDLAIDQVNVNELRDWRFSAGSPPKKSGASTLQKLTVNGSLSVGKVLYDQIVLTNVKAGVAMEGGVLKLNPLTADVFGGHEAGSITADLRDPTAAYSVRANLTGVDANQMLSSFSSARNILSGTVSGDTDVHFVSRANEDVAKSLNGAVKIQMGPGKLVGFHILDEMANIGRFMNWTKLGSTTQPYTTIQKMSGTLNIVNGLANTNDLQMVFDGGSLTAAGTMGLVDQALNLKLTTMLGQQVGQRVGGGQIGGLLTTVLANSRGELVIPAQVTGTMTKPKFAPDPARVAQMKLQGGKDPASFVSSVQGIVDAFGGKKTAAGTTQPAEQQKVPSLGDLFNQLKKKKEN